MNHNPGLFQKVCATMGVPEPIAEYRFHPERKWRFDFAWPGLRVALEVEGGIWTRGRHNHPAGFIKDMEKYNAAAERGWRVLRCEPKRLLTAETCAMIARTLALPKCGE